MEKRIVAFDIGDKRVGVAASDPFNTFALPGETYWRTKSAEADAANLAAVAAEKGAGLIVCGLPLNADGTESVQTEKRRAGAALHQRKERRAYRSVWKRRKCEPEISCMRISALPVKTGSQSLAQIQNSL